jgi:RHS repeat-associated protein
MWYRRNALPVAGVTSVVFLQMTLYSNPVVAAGAVAVADRAQEAETRSETVAVSSSRGEMAPERSTTFRAPTSPAGNVDAPAPREAPAPPTLPGAAPPGGGAISPQAASLPTGAATQLGMGESFSMQMSTGTAGYSLPITLPSARGRAQPSLGLTYSSGSGFGIAGLGWSFGAASISRQVDRGTPGYDDRPAWHPNQDRFVFAGAELVPVCVVTGGACAGALSTEVMPSWGNGWQYFRARIEDGFVRFFWSADHRTWRAQSKDGTNIELGVPLDGTGYAGALEVNPDAASQIFRWLTVRQYDGQVDGSGQPVNTIVYRYTHDGNAAYLTDVFDTSPAATPTTTDLSLYAHHTALSYETRPDAAVSYRSGFPQAVAWRLQGIDVTSKPFAAGTSAPRELVRRYHLAYETGLHRSLLAAVTLEGRCPTATSENGSQVLPPTKCPTLPPLTFEYQHVAGAGAPLADGAGLSFEPLDTNLQSLAQSPPHSLDERDTGLLDANGDGLPDVLVTAPGIYGGKHGLYVNGAGAGGRVGFGTVSTMGLIPTADAPDLGVLSLHSPTVTALDLDSDGFVDLVHMPQATQYSVFSPVSDGAGGFQWAGRAVTTASQQAVKINFAQDAPNVRVMDVDGDGLVDVVYSSATELQTFFALGRYPGGDGQFGSAVWTSASSAQISNDPVVFCPPWSSTPLRFSDSDVSIADMNGDGLPDIVRVRDGDIRYWPGRGNGFWGTGDRSGCGTNPFAVNREVAMAPSPRFGTYDPGSLLLNDVNGDGLADLVVVRSQAVDVFLNDDGAGWSAAQTIPNTPFRSAGRTEVRLTDINGSGTPDILWGDAGDYRYIDLTGGVVPGLLTHVSTGLGQTLDLKYESSASVMLAAAASGKPWQTFAPLSVPLVVSSTVSDHLDAVMRPAGTYVRQYDYRDPVYEGRQREFRGFSEVIATTPGDATGPTVHERTLFQLGECSLAYAQTAADVCTPPARWQDNWREALKGLPVVTEAFDDNGTYRSTTHTTFKLRQLYAGLDGRRVSTVEPIGTDTYVYDTPFDGQASSVNLDEVIVDIPSLEHTEPRTVVVRATAGTAHLQSSTAYDDFGNVTDSIRYGCVSGCPNGPDESITAHSDFALPANDASGWLYRQTHAYAAGSINTAHRNETTHNFDAFGNITTTYALLSGTLPLDFHHAAAETVAGQPPNMSGGTNQPVQVLTESVTYDPFGNAVKTQGSAGRCGSRDFDVDYQQLTIAARVMAGPADVTGCGTSAFVHKVTTYDRGIGSVVDSVDAQGQPQHFVYDGFGRVTSITDVDPSQPGKLAAFPTLTVAYQLPSDPAVTPYTTTILRTQTGSNPNAGIYSESHILRDGLGRPLVRLTPADTSAGDGGDWIASGYVTYDTRGEVARTYDPTFYSGPDAGALVPPPASTPYLSREYDAFGRPTLSFGYDHTVTALVVLHPLSSDLYDAAKILPTIHQGTYATEISDGHGRTVQSIARVRVGGALEQRVVLREYLPTGELVRQTQRRAGSPDVVRWMQYDSLGRLVLNAEPNTSVGFNPSPSLAGAIQAWRYAHDDAGNLVGFSDARGCGAIFYYDTGGRLLAEDRSPCLASQATYTPPNLTTGDGTETFFRYDASDPDTASVADDAGTTLPVNPKLLWGRVASVSSLASKAIYQYDALGHQTGTAVRVQPPGLAGKTLATRYAPRWYVRTSTFDAQNRVTSQSTGATIPALLGSDNASRSTVSFTQRGLVAQYSGSYGLLYKSGVVLADGRIQSFELGDASPGTQRFYTYDVNKRVKTVQTYHLATPTLWSSPPAGSTYVPPLPTDAPSRQLLLEDSTFGYDEVGNLTLAEDDRLPDDWPASAKPVTRNFEYDDVYRLTHTSYSYPAGSVDTWQSPFASEDADPTAEQPVPQVAFQTRPTDQRFAYDNLGNIQQSTDDSQGFWDRSTGVRGHGTPTAGPNQVLSASNRALAPAGAQAGDLSAAYDPAGNLTDLIVRRDGPCLPSTKPCWQRFAYEWDEVGELVHASRWDLSLDERASHAQLAQSPPSRSADADLQYAYDESSSRVLKSATDAAGTRKHTVYVFNSLEIRSADFDTTAPDDYVVDQTTEWITIVAGAIVAHVRVEQQMLPAPSSEAQHVYLALTDHLGSTTVVLDKATGELVEDTTYLTYGATESDYRPPRWGAHREPNKFTGKEEDIEVGLVYFGARYYSPYLNTWVSPDPVTIHSLGSDFNPYAYVRGTPLMAVDPEGRFLILVAIVIGLAVGAAIGAGSSIVAQGMASNWKSIDPVQVLLAGVAGAAAGAASGGIGGLVAAGITGAAGAGATAAFWGATAGGAAGGASGAMVGYTLDSAFSSGLSDWTLKDFAKATAVGAIGGAAGGAVGARLGGGLGGSAAAGLTGSAASYGASLLFGAKLSWEGLGLSLGSGLAGALTSEGVKDLALWAEVSGGSAADRQRVRDAIARMEETTHGKQLLQQGIARNREPLRVILNSNGEDFYESPTARPDTPTSIEINSNNYVSLDPSMKDFHTGKTLLIWAAKGSTDYQGPWSHEELEPETLESTVAHEIGHAWSRIYDTGPNHMDNVIANENPVRQELGLDPRSSYDRPTNIPTTNRTIPAPSH